MNNNVIILVEFEQLNFISTYSYMLLFASSSALYNFLIEFYVLILAARCFTAQVCRRALNFKLMFYFYLSC